MRPLPALDRTADAKRTDAFASVPPVIPIWGAFAAAAQSGRTGRAGGLSLIHILPQATRLIYRLQKAGVKGLPAGVLTDDECIEVLSNLLEVNGCPSSKPRN